MCFIAGLLHHGEKHLQGSPPGLAMAASLLQADYSSAAMLASPSRSKLTLYYVPHQLTILAGEQAHYISWLGMAMLALVLTHESAL